MNWLNIDRRPWMLLACLSGLVFAGCDGKNSERVQGYVEGEYVYVSCPTAGALQELSVSRGSQVAPGDRLFRIEGVVEQATRDEAARRVAMAKATLQDARKGRRPSEIQSLEAQLSQAQAALNFSTQEKKRQEDLARTGATPVQELDRARAAYDQDAKRVSQMEAELVTAKLGQREDLLSAAEENVRMAEATLAKAEWELSQKKQISAASGVVFDTLYRPGEWVPAGKPVVAILPPANVKVRAFVPQDRVSRLKVGDAMSVSIDGRLQPLMGKINFISPKVEFTPPVIYGQESRGKLVFMVEIVFDAVTSATLHPGQPVDVRLEP